MRGNHRTAIAMAAGLAALTLTASGCNGPSRRSLAASEPSLSQSGDSGVVIGDASVPAKVAVTPRASSSVVDRHPLLSRPRDYYESSGNNKFVKTAAATVIGVPAGIVGELRQIVTGTPATAAVPATPSY